MAEVTVENLVAVGCPKGWARGIVDALQHYPPPNLERYQAILVDALRYLLPIYPKEDVSDINHEAEEIVLNIIEELGGETESAGWNEILEQGKKRGIEEADVESALNALLAKNLIYEYSLGRFRRV